MAPLFLYLSSSSRSETRQPSLWIFIIEHARSCCIPSNCEFLLRRRETEKIDRWSHNFWSSNFFLAIIIIVTIEVIIGVVFNARSSSLVLASRSFRNWWLEILHRSVANRCQFLRSTYTSLAEARLQDRFSRKSIDFGRNFWRLAFWMTMGQTFGEFHWRRVEEAALKELSGWFMKKHVEGDRGCLPDGSCRKMCSQLCVDIAEAPTGASYNDFDIH